MRRFWVRRGGCSRVALAGPYADTDVPDDEDSWVMRAARSFVRTAHGASRAGGYVRDARSVRRFRTYLDAVVWYVGVMPLTGAGDCSAVVVVLSVGSAAAGHAAVRGRVVGSTLVCPGDD